jgi:hypothetical protein
LHLPNTNSIAFIDSFFGKGIAFVDRMLLYIWSFSVLCLYDVLIHPCVLWPSGNAVCTMYDTTAGQHCHACEVLYEIVVQMCRVYIIITLDPYTISRWRKGSDARHTGKSYAHQYRCKYWLESQWNQYHIHVVCSLSVCDVTFMWCLSSILSFFQHDCWM